MTTTRASGILLHPTSLPSRFGIGDLGPAAYAFADWLAAAGQRIWQVLPLGPVGYGESPYQLFSAFAGNPMLISPEVLVERGWLEAGDLSAAPEFAEESVAFEQVTPWKTALLHKAFETFQARAQSSDREELSAFAARNTHWLPGFTRFMALKDANGGRMWTEWDPANEQAACSATYHEFVQFEFFRQWCALKAYSGRLGIRMMGDLPIYVATDSADVWEHAELFDRGGMAGVPPDYFSATGQLWGNPLYRWDVMQGEGYAWWIERVRAALALFDLVRMDHFRGFEAYWAVPAGETTAQRGEWIKGPGAGELPSAGEPLPEGGESVSADMAASLLSEDPSGGDSGMCADVQSAPAQTSGPSEPANNADMIVVWRPDRSRLAQNRGKSESKHSTSATQGRPDADDHGPVPGRKWARDKKKQAQLRSTPAAPAQPPHAPKGADGPDPAQPEEKRRQRARDYDMPRLNTTTAPQHKAKVDLDSPFAKLLELRSLLEKQANKRP